MKTFSMQEIKNRSLRQFTYVYTVKLTMAEANASGEDETSLHKLHDASVQFPLHTKEEHSE
jgi:hypothetical protein